MVEKGPLATMKLGSTGMSTSHWCAIVALWFAPGTKEGHGTAQSARTYSFQSRILPTGYKVTRRERRVLPLALRLRFSFFFNPIYSCIGFLGCANRLSVRN